MKVRNKPSTDVIISNRVLRYVESRLERSAGCWKWNGPVTTSGYAVATFHYEQILVQRLLWEIKYKAKLPRGILLRRTCENKLCVNPTTQNYRRTYLRSSLRHVLVELRQIFSKFWCHFHLALVCFQNLLELLGVICTLFLKAGSFLSTC